MMVNPYDDERPERTRGSRGGKRGNRDRDSREKHAVKSMTAVAGEVAPSFAVFDEVETVETHVKPRRSLTHQQALADRPLQLETAPIPGMQLVWQYLGKANGRKWKKLVNGRTTKVVDGSVYATDGELIAFTNNRLVWKSDRTLLNLANPFPDIAPKPGKERRPQFKRITARSKERLTENEQPEILTPATPDAENEKLGIY